MTTDEREQIIVDLIANERCWDENDLPVLNEFSDNKLQSMYDQAVKSREYEAVVNTVREQSEALGLPAELTLNAMPAALAKALAAKKKPAASDGEEDMTDEEKEAAAKKKATTTNQQPLTKEQWLAQSPVEVREQFARNERRDEEYKTQLINQLTENVKEDQKTVLVNSLRDKTPEELHTLTALLPEKKELPRMNYMGAAAPTGKTFNDDSNEDLLPIPTINWGEKVAS